jgi:dipeptidyl-peptidase-4
MDTPQENPEGYKESSVFSYIDSYRGGLLLTHGTVDDNVHMQNTLQLADKLQDAGKPFQMMLYPRSRHGYRAAKREFDRRLELEFWMRSFFHKPISEEES